MVSEGLAAFVLERGDSSKIMIRSVARELLSSCVLRNLMFYFTPYTINKVLFEKVRRLLGCDRAHGFVCGIWIAIHGAGAFMHSICTHPARHEHCDETYLDTFTLAPAAGAGGAEGAGEGGEKADGAGAAPARPLRQIRVNEG